MSPVQDVINILTIGIPIACRSHSPAAPERYSPERSSTIPPIRAKPGGKWKRVTSISGPAS